MIGAGLDAARGRAGGDEVARLDAMTSSIGRALRASARLTRADSDARWSALASAFLAWRVATAGLIEEALDPTPLGPDDLPAALRGQWVGSDGSWLFRVIPAADAAGRSILVKERLEPFVSAVRMVAPDVLGPPVQILESSRLIVREYRRAAFYALAAYYLFHNSINIIFCE